MNPILRLTVLSIDPLGLPLLDTNSIYLLS